MGCGTVRCAAHRAGASHRLVERTCMTAKDDKNLQQVLDRIAKMDEPERSVMGRVH